MVLSSVLNPRDLKGTHHAHPFNLSFFWRRASSDLRVEDVSLGFPHGGEPSHIQIYYDSKRPNLTASRSTIIT
jgi:hypothetical protein